MSCPFIQLSLVVSLLGSQKGRHQLSGSFFKVHGRPALDEFARLTGPRVWPHEGEACPFHAQTWRTLSPPHFDPQLPMGLHPMEALRKTGIFLRILIKYQERTRRDYLSFSLAPCLHFIFFYSILCHFIFVNTTMIILICTS